MGILNDFSKRKAQELRNDQPTAETDQPSSQSTDDPTNNLEFVDRSDQKKNHTNGPHGDSTNKTAQFDEDIDQPRRFKKGDSVYWNDPDDGLASGKGVIINQPYEHLDEDEDIYGDEIIDIHLDDGGCAEVFAHELTYIPPDIDPITGYDEPVIASRNPFHVAQVKETGHVGGDMSDNETAETGHIGGGNPMKESPNGGGRTPGNSSNPDSVGPSHHDREDNAQGKQIT